MDEGHEALAAHADQFRKAVGGRRSDGGGLGHVGPFPHGTQAREYVLMVKYGMSPLAALQAGLLNGARVLGWQDQIGDLKAHYLADIVAVEGNPIEDINAVEKVAFVMKGGAIFKKPGE